MTLPAVYGQRSPSVVYDTGSDVPAHALFLDYPDENGATVTVEVFPRADGTTHILRPVRHVPLPLDPADVTPEPAAIARLEQIARGCRRIPVREDHRPPGLLSPGDRGRPAADRQGARSRGPLCRDRP